MKVSYLARQNVHLMLARLEQGVDDETAKVAQAARNSDDGHGGRKMAKRLIERIQIGERGRERGRQKATERKNTERESQPTAVLSGNYPSRPKTTNSKRNLYYLTG